MENKKKFDFKWIIIGVLSLLSILLCWKTIEQHKMIDEQTVQLSSKNTDDNKHTVITYDQNLETLKKNNKELYDSLKTYKDQIDYLVQFKYKKTYTVRDTIIKTNTIIKLDTIQINDTTKVVVQNEIKEEIKEYTYRNSIPNDTLNYQLTIGSTREPHWYAIDFEVGDKFTIVNKKVNNVNETTIETGTNDSKITGVTVVNTKKNLKTKFKDRIAVGPSVTAGYGFLNKNFDVVVGVSLTFDLW